MAVGHEPERTSATRAARPRAQKNGADRDITREELEQLLQALHDARDGDFRLRLPVRGKGIGAELSRAFNELAERRESFGKEVARVGRVIGRQGRMTERASAGGAAGHWAATVEALNTLIDDLVRPTAEVARVIGAVAQGDLSQKMALKIEGQSVKGEFLRMGTTVNAMVDQLSSFADGVTRVAREVGTEGKLGGQAKVRGVSGVWKDLTDNVNFMATSLTDQVRNIAEVTTAVATGDLSKKITADVHGEVLQLKDTINTMVDQLRVFSAEVTRVALEVGNEGRLGGQVEVEGVSGTLRDLTESVTMREDLVATVSHELRTPLAAIYGSALTLRRGDVDLEAELRDKLLEVIAVEAARLAEIVDDLLLTSQLDSGKLAVKIERCDPIEIARREVESARTHVPENVELVFEAPATLPPVAADPSQLRQVLSNLLDNAVKYSPEGGAISVELSSADGHVRFAVSDSGLGVPAVERERIFEKFYRLDPGMNRGIGGTGLGLYICRELVRRVDGQIWVEQGQGAGSMFVVEIPREQEHARSGPAPRPRAAATSR